MNNFLDILRITGLCVYAHHGILPEEVQNGQKFIIDIAAYLKTTLAAKNDNLAETVDYASLTELVVKIVKNQRQYLIETVAENIAKAVLDKYSYIKRIIVTVHKPRAPMPFIFEDVSITITRERH